MPVGVIFICAFLSFADYQTCACRALVLVSAFNNTTLHPASPFSSGSISGPSANAMMRAQLYPAANGPPVLLETASAALLYQAQISRAGPAWGSLLARVRGVVDSNQPNRRRLAAD
jgi:hypothetical protein